MVKRKCCKSITFKVPVAILFILLSGLGGTLTYHIYSLNKLLLASLEKEAVHEGNLITASIKNTMLQGNVTSTVLLFSELMRNQKGSAIALYRKDGIPAFSDNHTITKVNTILGKKQFTMKETFIAGKEDKSKNFIKAVKSMNDESYLINHNGKSELVTYRIIHNQPLCSSCHGSNHLIRGVIRIKSPVKGMYSNLKDHIIYTSAIYGTTLVTILVVTILLLRNVITLRIKKLADFLQNIDDDSVSTRIGVAYNDEIGFLGRSINSMMDNLQGRSEPVVVSQGNVHSDEPLVGESKTGTILISAIREMSYVARWQQPGEIAETVNEIINLQSGIIEKYHGTVVSAKGDGLAALFTGEEMELRSLRCARDLRHAIIQWNKKNDVPLYLAMGIHRGEIFTGTLDISGRMENYLLGDDVNMGLLLSSIAGNNTIVLSHATYQMVKENCSVKEHPPVEVKGKEPISVYTLRSIE